MALTSSSASSLVVALFGIGLTTRLLAWLRARQRVLSCSFDLHAVARKCIVAAQPYTFPPRFDTQGTPVLLDANENPYGPPFDTTGVNSRQVTLERYPNPKQSELKHAIATLRGCTPSQIFIGNGSDEVIDLLIRLVCTPGEDQILISSPTYAMYSVFAAINDVGVVDVPLSADGEFQLCVDAIRKALTRRVKLIFICSPGNPTSRLVRREDVEAIAAAATGALVVVDEAYIDFATVDGAAPTCVPLISEARYPNLVVSQTLSKAWGLAGARLGIAIAPMPVVALVDKLKAPFNLSVVSEDIAIRAIAKADVVEQRVRTIVAERERMARALVKCGPGVQRVHASDANFLLVKIEDAVAVCATMLRDSNVVVRPRCSMLHCDDCVRITIGTPAENDLLLVALRSALGAPQQAPWK